MSRVAAEQPNIGSLVRKYGHLYECFTIMLKELSEALEAGKLERVIGTLLNLSWEQTSASMAKLATEMTHLDQRIPNLCRNVLAGEYKAFKRALMGFRRAKHRQQTWLNRIAAGKDVDDDVVEDGVLLIEGGMPTMLYFEHFYEDKEQVMDELWAKARNVSR